MNVKKCIPATAVIYFLSNLARILLSVSGVIPK